MCKAIAYVFALFLPIAANAAEGLRVAATAAISSSSAMNFVIRVPRVLQMRLIDHPSSVLVTPADIAQGEIVVRGPRVEIVANNRNGLHIRAELRGHAFAGMRLSGLAREIRAQEAASVTTMPSTTGEPRFQSRNVEYRLRLAADTSPGQYAWPVALTIQDP